MRPALGQLEILDHENDIRLLNGCQMVGNHYTGFAFHQAVQSLENYAFGLRVES